MDDRAAAGPGHHGDVLADAVERFHLEAPPVRPHVGADAVLGQLAGDLVGLDGVVKGGDVIAELVRDVDHLEHLVGAVAVVLHQDRAVQDPDQRLEPEIALGRLLALAVLVLLGVGGVVLPALAVVLGADPRLAVAGDVAHARRGRLAMLAVDPLGILAAGHFQPVRRAGKLHRVDAEGRHVLDGDAAPAEQVGGAGKDLHGGHAAGEGEGELRVLRPDRMLRPDVGGVRIGRLVAVGVGRHRGRGVDPEMRVSVDQPGSHPFAGAVDHLGPRGSLDCRGVPAHGGDPAVAQQHGRPFQPLPGAGQHRGIADQHGRGRPPLVGRKRSGRGRPRPPSSTHRDSASAAYPTQDRAPCPHLQVVSQSSPGS